MTRPNSARLVLSPLLLLVALLTTLGLNASSAAANAGPETRVRAIPTVVEISVGQQSGETAGGVGCLRPSQPGLAPGSCVATEAAPFGELASPATVNNAGSPIRSFVTEADTTYLRVYSGDKTAGGFLVGSAPSSADSAVSGLALPPGNNAGFIQEVLVPSGTRLQSSIAAPAFGQPGGLLQFELLDQIPVKNFGPGLPFR